MARVVVVGGGISGLTVAHALQRERPTDEILVLERNPSAGGTIGTCQREGFTIETGPNGFLDNNPCTADLARSLGLGERMVAASDVAGRNRFLFLDGRLRLLPSSPPSLLGTDLLSWPAKLRLLTEAYRPRRRTSTDESIHAFACRRVGNEIAHTFGDAFVTGILAGDPKLLSMEACFPRLVKFEREHGSVMRGMAHAARERRRQQALNATPSPAPPRSFWQRLRRSGRGPAGEGSQRAKMWSFAGGLQVLVDTLAAQLRRPPLTGVPVRRVLREEAGWRVEAEGRDAWPADAVILACPAYSQAELLAGLDEDLACTIGGIPYTRVAVVALGYRREDVRHPLAGFGYISPQRTRREVLGVQWCSSIYPARAPSGMVLLRALCGGWHRGDVLDWPDARLLEAVRAELAQSMGVTGTPALVEIVRWHRAIPQYHVGHLARIAWVASRLESYPGLFVGGNAYRGVAINDCVEQGTLLAGKVSAWLEGRGASRP